MKFRLVFLVFCSLVLSVSCSSFPDAARIKKDMVGQRFFYHYKWGFGGGGEYWTIEQGDIISLTVKDKHSSGNMAEVTANLTAKKNGQTIRGDVLIGYKKYDQGWKVRFVRSVKEQHGASFDMRVN